MEKPGRLELVVTTKHRPWRNMIDMFFSKISRSFLRHTRLEGKKELTERIYQGINNINEEPVGSKWKYIMKDISII